MVQLKSLKSDPTRKIIKNVIKSSTGEIVVYEPTKEDIEVIMGLEEFIVSLNGKQNKENKPNESELEISDTTVMKKIIPLLTDIEIGDMTDEEIQQVLDHPSLAMMEVNQILTGIVTSVYKMVLLSYANQMQSQELSLETVKLNHEAVGQFVTRAAGTDKGKELLEKVMYEADEVNKLQHKELKSALENTDDSKQEEDRTEDKSTEQKLPNNDNHVVNLERFVKGRFGTELE